MISITGKIERITKENNNGRDKKVVWLRHGNNTVFVEFQGEMIELLNEFNEGQMVSMRIMFNGKVSSLGRYYNNIIGKTIKQL